MVVLIIPFINAETDYVLSGNGGSLTISKVFGGFYGVDEYVRDNNPSTSQYGRSWDSSPSTAKHLRVVYTTTVTFPLTDIHRIEFQGTGPVGCGCTFGGGCNANSCAVDILKDGTWNQIFTLSGGFQSQTGSWNNVQGVRSRVDMYMWSSVNDKKEIRHDTYEIHAFGPELIYFQDSGLRIYNGSQTISIAAEINTADSPLKFYNGSDTLGLALVSVGDVDGSKVRIRVNSTTTMELRKY